MVLAAAVQDRTVGDVGREHMVTFAASGGIKILFALLLLLLLQLPLLFVKAVKRQTGAGGDETTCTGGLCLAPPLPTCIIITSI